MAKHSGTSRRQTTGEDDFRDRTEHVRPNHFKEPPMPEEKKRKSRAEPSYALEVHEHYLVVEFNGDLTASIIAQTTDEIHSDPAFRTLNDLWDLRSCSAGNLNYGQVQNIFAHIRSRGFREHQRSAIVVSDEHHFGLSRIYQALSENEAQSHLSVEIFRDIEAARQWVASVEE